MMFKTKPGTTIIPPQPGPRGGSPKAPVVPTIISADMVVDGNLKTAGDVQIEGVVNGQIEAGRLVIAESGTVTGNVTAETARICGTLNGNINGAMVTLTASAKVTGDVLHDLLAIEAGGLLEGLSRRRALVTPELAAPKAAAPKAEAPKVDAAASLAEAAVA
jgi:cytoskeletal protein CcmA (bactofilin family)